MTLAELEAATARLGFTPSLDDGGELLRDAAARALGEIALTRPRIAQASLWHYPDVPLYSEGSTESLSEERTVSVSGGNAFYLRITGRGRLTVQRGTQKSVYSFSSSEGASPAVLGGVIPTGEGELTLHFLPYSAYRILSLAIYEGAYPGRPPDPFAPKEYDLSSLLSDFGALIGPPRSAEGEALCEGANGDYTLQEGHLLSINRAAPCQLLITYRRTLGLPPSGDLPVTDEEAALLPLYCAAYVFLDDDPEKATFYLARFTEGIRRLAREDRGTERYRDTTGWG